VSTSWEPAPRAEREGSLQRRVARGLAWTVVDTWGRQLINLAVFTVLARLLTGDDFGIVALAAVFVAFAQILVDQGLGDAVIQRRDITRSHVDTAFWVAVATGVVLTLALVVLSGPIAALFDQPDLQPILAGLAVSFLLAALSSIQIALLRRELAFRSLAVRAILASIGGGAAGIALAIAGFGPWALVAQQLVAAAISVVTLWTLSPWRPSWRASRQDFRELFPFGSRIVGSDILTFLSRQGDNLLIGAVLGTGPLGFYAVGYRLLESTQVMLVNVARKITFPVFSRLAGDPERMRGAYLRVTRAAGAVILPGYVGMSLVASELIPTLFGDGWEQSAQVAAVLFLIGPVLTVQAFSGSFLNAAGHPEVVLRFRLISTVTNLVGFAIGVSFGILAVAAASVIRGYLLLPLNLRWMRVYGGVPVAAHVAELRGALAATVVMVATILGLKWAAGPTLSDGALLAVEAVGGGLVFAGVLWVVDRRTLRELWSLAGHAMKRGGRPPAADVGERTDVV
jgi:PST family polysaccharide transporter